MQHRRNDAAAVIQPMDVNWWRCLLLALFCPASRAN
jgi:hypothetical protein